MHLYHNIENDLVIDIHHTYYLQQLIQQIKQHFSSFGYQEVHTSAFEAYDLYVKMNGTVNHHEMLKTIDNTGKVLVLRPDITIPLTQQIAFHNTQITEDLRYFYVLDVFRQKQETNDNRKSTQAGIEYFGNASPEADAEIIALAIELLQQMELTTLKIELGHAGFFAQLIELMTLSPEELSQLKQFIQAKNVAEMEQFLQYVDMDKDLKQIVLSLPFLYGEPQKVIQKAKQLPLNDNMLATLQNITDIYENITAHGLQEYIVLDLSLINHMDYYSDMIFQGFIENIGKPIIMGGRYNTLAAQFGSNIPASGFACDLDILTDNLPAFATKTRPIIDFKVLYESKEKTTALELARKLRGAGFQVVTYQACISKEQMPQTNHTITLNQGTYSLFTKDKQEKNFSAMNKLLAHINM